jgi:hypothetical protein
MSDRHREINVFPKFNIQFPCLSFLDKSFYWLPYQQIKFHNIKDVEIQQDLGSFTKIGRTHKIHKLGTMCPERLFSNLVVGANGISFNKGKIGFIASKDHEIRKIPLKYHGHVKYHRKK